MIPHQFIRYVIAVLAAVIIGQVVQVAAAIFTDLMAGAEVTGGRWSLNVANVAVICVQGAAVGGVAGAIARKRAILISAIAIFLPLIAFVLVELIENRDFSNYIATEYDTNPALWTWVALIPAMRAFLCEIFYRTQAGRSRLALALVSPALRCSAFNR